MRRPLVLTAFLGLACLQAGCKSNSTNAPEPSLSLRDSRARRRR
ncbi:MULTISPECIES: hypothetical protein [Corallococcus]|nr:MULTISPECIES: hypothetical protein [Corallococcus]